MGILVEASCGSRIRANESEAPHDLDVARFDAYQSETKFLPVFSTDMRLCVYW